MKKILFATFIMVVQGIAVWAQTNPTPQNIPYAQSFGSLSHTSTSYPAGWQGWVLSSSPSSSYNTSAPSTDRVLTASSTASVNSGNVHNYDGKIGFLNNSSTDLALVLAVNTSGKNNVVVQYDIMTIRNPYNGSSNTRVNEVSLQYRVGTSGGFTTLSGVAYQNNTTTQTTGITTPQNSSTKTITLPSACNNQSIVQLRWVSLQVSGGGSRPSFAVDNITVDTAINPLMSVTKTADAVEGVTPTAGTFSFSFNPSTTASTTVNYAITGTATFGTDYGITLSGSATPATLTGTTGTITIPASASSITATVTPIDDANSEGTETVIITLSSPSGGYMFADSVATMNLIDDEATFIHDIQGSGSAATAGDYTVEGIVTGIYTTLSPAGFYLQEEDADADNDPNTSEGIFVVTNTTVAVGDKVRVAGTAQENGSSPSYQQAVLNNTTVSIISNNNALPTATQITLPVANATDYEKYECMLVVFRDTLTVTDNYNLGTYGEINLSKGGMVYQPTQVVDPNDAVASGTTASGATNLAAVNAMLDDNGLRTILLDDGRGTIPTLPYVDANNTLRLGSTVDSLMGIMGYAFSVYRVQPVPYAYPTFNYAARPTTVPSVGANANVKVASFNVLNYFNGDGTGGGFPTARGAHSAAEFTRQRDKIINAIAEIDADVVGLIEMENDGTNANSALADLVSGLNTKMGAGTYSFVNDGATIQPNNTDAIRCAIIYKSANVSPVGAVMISSSTVYNRPPVAQAFALVSNGEKFNFIINHFKSKGCSSSTGADQDQMDGQGCYNFKRKQQAGELINFINNTVIPTSGSGMVLTVGDYNAYFEEDPLDTMRAEGFTVLGAADKYSYLYFGQVGSLDNAVVSDSLESKVTGLVKWNINSVEPRLLDYNDVIDDGGTDYANPWGNLYTDVPFRSSDHDPIIIGLELVPAPNSVAKVAADANISIYPNPANSTVYINNKDGKAMTWQLVNTLGQSVALGNMNQGQQYAQVNVSNLSAGVYILQMITADGEHYTSLVSKN